MTLCLHMKLNTALDSSSMLHVKATTTTHNTCQVPKNKLTHTLLSEASLIVIASIITVSLGTPVMAGGSAMYNIERMHADSQTNGNIQSDQNTRK